MNIKENFIRKMQRFIQEQHLLDNESKMCCALSGGADSVALLMGMLMLKDKLSVKVSAVHVNHCLRGEESGRDEQFCRELCKRCGVDLHVYRCDVNAYREKNGGSVETAARQCRYAVFEKEEGVIATAHTASDNLETILQRIARGAGLHGLCGIPVKRGRFIRPVLFASRQEIEEFLKEIGEEFVTDSSNNSNDYTRNRIRHNIVPLLQEINPSVEKTVSAMCRSLRDDDEFFDNQCSAAFEKHFRYPLCLVNIQEIPKAVRVRCIARILEKCNITYDSKMLDDIEKIVYTGGRCHLAGNYDCFVSRDELVIRNSEDSVCLRRQMVLTIGCQSLFDGIYFHTRLITEQNKIDDCIINKKYTNSLLDYDKIKGCITLRNRKPGDRFQPAGRGFSVSIKKRIQEEVPLSRRQTLHFLEDEEGLIYVEGIGIAERVKPVRGETRRLLAVSVTYDSGKFPDREKE